MAYPPVLAARSDVSPRLLTRGRELRDGIGEATHALCEDIACAAES